MALRVLALETSSDCCSVALWADGEVAERRSPARATHSELVLPFVRELLVGAGITLASVDLVAFGAGPGGFTGLRLACGVAQGLAFGADLPVLGIGSLEALAAGCAGERIYTCVDARMDEVYFAAYERHGVEMREVLAPAVAMPDQVELPALGRWDGVGTGFSAHRDSLAERLRDRVSVLDAAAVPRAADVAALAARRYARGERSDAVSAAPIYVRDKVALTTAERLARGGKH